MLCIYPLSTELQKHALGVNKLPRDESAHPSKLHDARELEFREVDVRTDCAATSAKKHSVTPRNAAARNLALLRVP